MKDILENAFISEGFTLTAQQTEQFVTYYELLMEWNQKIFPCGQPAPSAI